MAAPQTPVKAFLRDMTWWLTDRTIERTLHDLHRLGYEGSSLSGVDPDTEGFHEFRGREVELACHHENGENDKTFERWTLPAEKRVAKDKSELQRLDRLLVKNQRPTTGIAGDYESPITNDDVLF
jgi:hypothetical protein